MFDIHFAYYFIDFLLNAVKIFIDEISNGRTKDINLKIGLSHFRRTKYLN